MNHDCARRAIDLADDCDASADEAFADLGEACDGADKDLCENGFVACAPGGKGVQCTGEAPTGDAEYCNSDDDDCDGATDDDCDGATDDDCDRLPARFACGACGYEWR